MKTHCTDFEGKTKMRQVTMNKEAYTLLRLKTATRIAAGSLANEAAWQHTCDADLARMSFGLADALLAMSGVVEDVEQPDGKLDNTNQEHNE